MVSIRIQDLVDNEIIKLFLKHIYLYISNLGENYFHRWLDIILWRPTMKTIFTVSSLSPHCAPPAFKPMVKLYPCHYQTQSFYWQPKTVGKIPKTVRKYIPDGKPSRTCRQEQLDRKGRLFLPANHQGTILDGISWRFMWHEPGLMGQS